MANAELPQGRSSRVTPRARIIGGALAIAIAATAWIVVGLMQDRALVEKSAGGRTLNRAAIVSQYVHESFRRVEVALGHTADEAMRAAASGRGAQAELRFSLEAFVTRGGLITRMAIVDKDGNATIFTGQRTDWPASFASVEVFSRQRAGETGKLVFGTPTRAGGGKARLLPASMRLNAPDGSFAGIVMAEIDTSHFNNAFGVLGKEPGGFYTLFLRSGAVIARTPDEPDIVDRNWADSPMFREHLPGASRKTVRQVVAATGIESLYSYDSLTEYPVVTASGLSLTGVLEPWRERVKRDLLLLAGGLAILALGTWIVLRTLRLEQAAYAALAASERDLALAQEAGRIGSIIIELASGLWITSNTGAGILGLEQSRLRPHREFESLLTGGDEQASAKAWRAGLVSNARTDELFSLGNVGTDKQRWIRLVTSVEFSADGNPQRRIGIVQDVTAQVLAEQRVLRLSDMYATLSKTNEAAARAPDFSALCEAVCRVVVENAQFASAAVRLHDPDRNVLRLQALESAPEALRGHVEIPADSRSSLVAAAFMRAERIVAHDIASHPDAQGIAAEAIAHGVHAAAVFPLLAEGHAIGTFTVFARDGSRLDDQTVDLLQEVARSLEFSHAKHASDAARREIDTRMGAVVSSAMDAIITCDEAMHIVLFNDSASKMFRCPVEDAIATPLERFVPQRFRGEHPQAMTAFSASTSNSRNMGRSARVSALRADGEEFPAEASISHTVVGGRVLYTVIMRDVTERLAAEGRIQRLTQLYAALSATNEAIVRIRDWKHLCDEVCRIIVERGGVVAAALRMLNASGTHLEVVASHGPRSGAIGERPVALAEGDASIAVPVYRSGKIAVINDFATHPVASKWLKDAQPVNVNAAVVLPLRAGDSVVGVMSVYASTPGHFDGELSRLMGDLADNLGFAHAKLANERAVVESEERFRALTMMASDWYWETDREHRFTRMSQGLQASEGGFDPSGVLGKTRWDFGPMVMDPEAMQVHRETLERRASFRDFEYRRIGPDGRVTMRCISGDPVFDANGEFTGYRGVGRNVTEQRLAEVEMRASEERYRTLVDASPDAIRVVCDGRIVFVNPACVRLWGAKSQDEIIGRDPLEFIRPENHARATERLRRVIKEGASAAPIETVYIRPDGSSVDVETISLPFNFNGRPAALSIMRDLTERNDSQRALTEAERRYRSLVEASQGGVLLLAGDVVAYANPGLGAMLGFSRQEEIPGTSLYSMVLLESHEALRSHLRRLSAHANQTMPRQDLRMRRRDGETINVTATATSIDLDGQTMIQMELRDVTRERLAMAQVQALNETLEVRIAERTRELTKSNNDLEAANRDLESFSYSVAHDLRAPLRSMAGFAALLEMDVATGALDELPGHTARITQNAVRMNALIDGLLAVSRVTHGELKDEEVDFTKLVAETLRECNPGAHVQVTADPLPVMHGDTSALRQVWANLLSNALKYSAKRAAPQVQVGVELRDTEYVFHVRDNGAGFDPAFSQRLFGVFQRLHSSHEFEGTGVGLAVVRRVIERHGGHVWAEGRPNLGATFYFTLPAARLVAPPA